MQVQLTMSFRASTISLSSASISQMTCFHVMLRTTLPNPPAEAYWVLQKQAGTVVCLKGIVRTLCTSTPLSACMHGMHTDI